MKKVVVICITVVLGLLIISSNQDKLLIMRIMNQAADLSSTSSDSNWFGTSASSRHVDSGGFVPGVPRNQETGSTFIPSGMDFGNGNEFDYLKLLQQVQQGGGAVEYENGAELIKFYTDSATGNFDPIDANWTQHALPQFIATVHRNETNYGIWGGSEGGSELLGTTWNGQTVRIDNMNEEMITSLVQTHNSESLWKDNGGDGYPDGPFQIENANPSGRAYLAAQNSSIGAFDVYSFRDGANMLHEQWNTAYTRYGDFASGRELGALAGTLHNRGSVWQQVYGLPYWGTGEGIDGQHRSRVGSHASDNDTLTKERAVSTVKEVISSWDTSGLSMAQGLINSHQRGLCALLLIRKGWYLDGYYAQPVESSINSFMNYYPDDNNHPMRKMFPDENFADISAMLSFVQSKRASLHEVLTSEGYNLTVEQVDEIYGTRNGYYKTAHFQHTLNNVDDSYSFIFKVEDKQASGVYEKAGSLGITVPFVQCFDAVHLTYFLNTGVFMDNFYVELALKSGMANAIDGKSVDSSNPAFFYGGDIGFDPVYGDGYEAIENAYRMLGYSEEQVHPLAKVFMLSIWGTAGGPYTQTGGNQYFTTERWDDTTGGDTVGSKGYWTLYGSSSSKLLSTKWSWEDLYTTMLANDCSRLVKVGLVLGNPDLIRTGSTPSNTSELMNRIRNGAFSCSAVDYNGQTYNATLYQIDGEGNLMAQIENGVVTDSWFSTDESYSKQGKNAWASYLQPGDIVVRQGHTESFFGVNKTGATVTIPPEMTKRRWDNSAMAATVPAMQAVFMAHNGADGHSGLLSSKSGGGGWDDYSHRYYALRPAYLINGLDSPGFTCP